jgi:hypothetical protein
MTWMLVTFAIATVGARWGSIALAKWGEEGVQYEEALAPAVMELGLHRDGVMPIGPPSHE